MKQPVLAAMLCLAAASGSWAAPSGLAAQGPALIVASDRRGGLFAPGDVAAYRALNPSPTVALGPLKASVDRARGFKVLVNGCSLGLAPGQGCSVLVSWSPPAELRGPSLSSLVLSSQSPAIEVSNALVGELLPSPR